MLLTRGSQARIKPVPNSTCLSAYGYERIKPLGGYEVYLFLVPGNTIPGSNRTTLVLSEDRNRREGKAAVAARASVVRPLATA